MRFNTYINEKKKPKLIDTFQLIYNGCMPYINDLVTNGFNKKDVLLYRGMGGAYTYQIKKKTRINRKPKDSTITMHNALDKAFYNKFGIKGRSNSIFCSGSYKLSSEYGKLYVIFPIGKYEVIWSKEVEDMYIKFRNEFNLLDSAYMSNPEKHKDSIDNFAERIANVYQKGDIMGALRSGNEMMISTKEYYGFSYGDYVISLKTYIRLMGIKYPNEKNIEIWFDTIKDPAISWDDLGIE